MTLDVLKRQSVPVAAETRSRGTHFPCFDGLRAIAALTVIGVHTAFASGFTTKHPGWGRYTSRLEIGVEVFFVISGFLLYRPFVAHHFGGRSAPGLKLFWTRRLKRIIPAYWIAFLVVTYILKADSGGAGWKGPLIYLGFAQIYFPTYTLHGLSQAWSLCTEMSFYLFLPFYAAAIGMRRRTPAAQLRVELAGLGALTAVNYVYLALILPHAYFDTMHHRHKAIAPVMPNWLPGTLALFALGMFLAVISAYFASTDRRPAWLWHPATPWVSWGLAALCFWSVSNIGLSLLPLGASPLGPSLARQTLYGLFGFFMVVPAVFGVQDRSPVRSVLRWRPLALIGIVSYGVYLWHEGWMHMYFTWTRDPLFDVPLLYMVVAVTVLAVAAATLSYRLLERPILKSKGIRIRRAAPAPAALQPNLSGVGS
jgi:peptidoglycan/LPS O-acetylase OafA/YrhL